MNANLKRKINSMSFILRSTNLLYNLSQYKYIQHYNIVNNLNSIINVGQDNGSKIDQYVVFIDNRSMSILHKINEIIQQAQNVSLYVLCSNRCYEFLHKHLDLRCNIDKIANSLIYDLNVNRINKHLYYQVLNKISIDIKSINIINFYIDGKHDHIVIQLSKNDLIWNNISSKLPVGRYVMYMLNKFMYTYFLFEVSRNREAKNKVEKQIKYFKLLLNSVIIARKRTNDEQ